MQIDPRMPQSRKLVAVPFVGKDVPSRASEFAHPDIVLGFTILAYRYEGLRATDFGLALSALREQAEEQYGVYNKRPACVEFARWVALAGGRVRGFSREQFEFVKTESEKKKEKEQGAALMQFEEAKVDNEFDDIWPLQLIDLHDPEQMWLLYRLLHKLAHMVRHYLFNFIFPPTMAHQSLKLRVRPRARRRSLVPQPPGFSARPRISCPWSWPMPLR